MAAVEYDSSDWEISQRIFHSMDLPSWPGFMTDIYPEGMFGLPDISGAVATNPKLPETVRYTLARVLQTTMQRNTYRSP